MESLASSLVHSLVPVLRCPSQAHGPLPPVQRHFRNQPSVIGQSKDRPSKRDCRHGCDWFTFSGQPGVKKRGTQMGRKFGTTGNSPLFLMSVSLHWLAVCSQENGKTGMQANVRSVGRSRVCAAVLEAGPCEAGFSRDGERVPRTAISVALVRIKTSKNGK
ncbi:hypothetical protein B0H66DRAFT_254936 [Apodospora peruviana]|uniref:Uncharacterized protein n=1 Tax=Apodospora peruviana TaxID=516989 RepID=A0AAE0M4U0_9PEZI|nr:hypothetical protein B0H66DRAFT_254936 [Apodospora peruviana]